MTVILQSVLPFLAMIVVLIVIHELGHYITAKMANVKVLEFGLGYPPRAFGIKRGETEYTVNWIPLGGFVRLLGEEDPDDPRSLASKPRWVRLVVLASGAAMNVALAILLFSMALMIPRDVDQSRARISEVVPNSPAQEAGLQPGDVIFAVDGRDVQNIAELSYRIRLNLGETFDMRVRRADADGAQFLDIPVRARWSAPTYIDDEGEERAQGPTGITISAAYGSVVGLTPEEQALYAEEFPGEEVPTTRFEPVSGSQWDPPWVALPEGTRRSWESLVLARNEIGSRIQGGFPGGGAGFQVTGPGTRRSCRAPTSRSSTSGETRRKPPASTTTAPCRSTLHSAPSTSR